MNDELDEMLRRSRPEVMERSPRLTAALDDLVESHAAPVRRRWRRPLITGSFIVFALAGGASIAAATPGVLAWFGLNDNSMSYLRGDEQCHEVFRVVPADWNGSRGGNPPIDTPALRAAQEYLTTLDIDSLDLSEQLAENAASGRPPRDEESYARSTLIFNGMIEHLESLGLPIDNVGLNGGGNCVDPR